MNSSLSLSFELIYLMGWLLKHNKAKLTALVTEAVESGLIEELTKMSEADYLLISDQMQVTVENFMEHLETTLFKSTEGIDGIESDNVICKSLATTMRKVDTAGLDTRTVWVSIHQAHKKIISEQKNTELSKIDEEPDDILYEQLLSNWTPSNNETLN